MKNLINRYLFATVGLFLVAFGAALSAIANLGIAPLSSLAYLFNMRFPLLSFGEWIFVVNLFYMIFQIIFWGKSFKLKYLLQLIASLLFSLFVDASMLMIAWIPNETLLAKFVIILIASLVTAIGISMELRSNAWMLSAEMTVASCCDRFPNFMFSRVKMAMDIILVLLTAFLSYLIFDNFLGAGEAHNIIDQLLARVPGAIIGFGTLILAFLPGFLVRYSDNLFKNVKFK